MTIRKTILRSQISYSLLFFGLISFTACSSNSPSIIHSGFDIFDSFLNNQFVKNKLNQDYPLEFIVDTLDNKKSYSYTLKFNQINENQYYLFGVAVAKAGVLLNADELKSDKKNADSSLNEINFPRIGKRAKRETGFFGPGGSSYGLVFTTTDGLYDVKIVVSMLLPENVDSPDIDIRHAARTISNIYDEHQQKN